MTYLFNYWEVIAIKDFFTLFLFNYKKILNTWMTKIMIAIAVIGVFAAAMFFRQDNEKKDVLVNIKDNAGINVNVEDLKTLLSSNSTHYNYIITASPLEEKNYVNTIIMEFNKLNDSNIELKFDYDDRDLLSNEQKSLISKLLEMQIMSKKGIQIPQVVIKDTPIEPDEFLKNITYYIIIFIIYLFILLCGSILTSSVALEKTSKVTDLIVYRVSSIKIVYSKVLALYAILMQIILLAALEVFFLSIANIIHAKDIFYLLEAMGFGGKTMLFIGLISITGITIYTVLYIIVGLLIESAEQIQYSQLPVAAIALIAFIVSVLSRSTPNSLLTKIATYVPPFFPFVAPLRVLNHISSTSEIVFAFIIVVLYLILGNYAITRLFMKEAK